MGEACGTKFYPVDVERMSEGSKLREHLAAGREVVVGPNGWILDSWDPVTKKLYDADGTEYGTREKTLMLPDTSEHRIQGAKIYLPEQASEFDEGGDMWTLLINGNQVTLSPRGRIIDVWDPATKKVLDIFGGEVGNRDTPYPEYTTKEVDNPLRYTNTLDDALMYDPEHWHMGFINQGYHVTVDSHGDTLDIWDPATGDIYDSDGNKIGTRTDPYPSDNNMSNLKAEVKELGDRITALRRQLRTERGYVKSATNTKILLLLRERGQKLWQWGRLLNRKRRMDVAYQKRVTSGG